MSAITKLLQIVQHEARSLEQDFAAASIKGRGTPQEVADFREQAFRQFIQRYFPFPYRVTKGNIADSFGNESASIDCVIINPVHPYILDAPDKLAVILADGVDAAIEVKPDLMTVSELERGLKQIQTVKSLLRRNAPILLSRTRSAEFLEYARRIPSFIFATSAKTDPLVTVKDVCNYYTGNAVPVEQQVDYIAIHNVGIISNYQTESSSRLSVQGQKILGVVFEEWKEHTLARLLLYLNETVPASPRMSDPILPFYLGSLAPPRYCIFSPSGELQQIIPQSPPAKP